LDELKEIITKDGSISLKSKFYDENFHSQLGAIYEAQKKFIDPSQINRFAKKSLNVLDICFGLGYNSALLFKNIKRQSSALIWYGLEIDRRPLKYALNNKLFRDLWDHEIVEILNSILIDGIYRHKNIKCNLLWGDARSKIESIPKDINFDLIFLDGFSPQKCPEIWSFEFLEKVIGKLKPKGSLVTYSSSAAVRKTLMDLDLKIFNIKPNINSSKNWSNGTLAIANSNKEECQDNPYIEDLSFMQKEHLSTKSSIPYRDPNGKNLSEEILKRRRDEQSISNLKATNLWRKKWKMTKSTFNS
tara:strand:+ start:12959 stop:13864 length:906 start_codon:yes stop_codon:yes gene_type:complete